MQIENPLMRQLIKFILPLVCANCLIADNYSFSQTTLHDNATHFYSIVDKAQYDTLMGNDFTWIIFRPINDTLSNTLFRARPAFIQNLSTEQKALFHIWELERAVYGGESGFANFYYNYESYFSETIKALTLINDTAMLNVMLGVNKVYLTHHRQIQREYERGDWKYIQRKFAYFDKAFFDKHEYTMKLLENFIRLHTEKFVRFK
jgi:hypothetical protein